MTSDVKPCPFCGGLPKKRCLCGQSAWIECSECGVSTLTMRCATIEQAKAEAISAWNRRADDVTEEAVPE